MASPVSNSILIAGPTAVGKSEIALRLAEHLGGEIISVDSMQVYRGLDIGTAKPSPAERARVTHHVVDVVSLSEAFDAARFVALAGRAMKEIQARGRVPIFCGGTGLYFKALLQGIGESPPASSALRAALEVTPLESLLSELRERDAVTYERIDRQNPRRVIRAVEVIRLTGRPFSEQRAEWNHASRITHHQDRFFGFSRNLADLHHRIDLRVERMFVQGLVDETRRLLEAGLAQNQTAMQAIGYRQVVAHLRGERPLRETIELVKSRTRQFAKRQLTWFKRHAAPIWIALSPNDAASRIVTQIANDLAAGGRRS